MGDVDHRALTSYNKMNEFWGSMYIMMTIINYIVLYTLKFLTEYILNILTTYIHTKVIMYSDGDIN